MLDYVQQLLFAAEAENEIDESRETEPEQWRCGEEKPKQWAERC